MHIIVDAAPLGERQKAGVATYALNLLNSLAKLDAKNRRTLYSMRLHPETLGIVDNSIKVKSVPDLFKFLPFWYSWTFWYYTGFPIQLLADKPDLFLSMHPVLPLYCPYPRVVVVCDLSPLVLKNAFKVDFRFRFSKQVLHAVRHANEIITISQSTKKDLIDLLGAKPENIHVIYPGYEDSIFEPETDLDRVKVTIQRYNINHSYILYVGTLEPKKNIPRLIEAFASLKNRRKIDQKLVIVGKRAWNDEAVFQAAKENGVETEIIFTGYVPQEELSLLMNGADVFVFPSLHEGFGIPPLEAMACGAPVITSNVSSLPEVIGDAGLLVDPYNVEDIAESIYRVVSNGELRGQMRQKGLRRAKLFSWEKAGKETIKIFEAVYDSRRIRSSA